MRNEAETRKRARNGSVSKIVLEYGMQHPGQLLHVNQIASDTGLDASQIRSAIRKMMEPSAPAGLGSWEVALRGNAWTYQSAKPAVGANFVMIEIIGALDGDRKLVRAEDGAYAVITPVNL